MYASITCRCASMENSNVMFTLIPSAMSERTARAPSAVPGIFTITLGRSTVDQSRLASATEAAVSLETPGETSIDT